MTSTRRDKMMRHDTELSAILMPDCALQFEWTPPAADGPRANQAMQDDIFARFTMDPEGWLFSLGFCAKSVPLSPSLTFWRAFSGLFIQKLKLTPDLEELRADAAIPLDSDERDRLLESAPLMPGGEYLNAGPKGETLR